jgi:hypothetical protein
VQRVPPSDESEVFSGLLLTTAIILISAGLVVVGLLGRL